MEINTNILVTGATGQLGSMLKKTSKNYPYCFFFKNKKELDLTNFLKIEKFITKNKINVVINCAAYTDVNTAETNNKLANHVNNIAVDSLAKICSKNKIQLIHISTDYVFDGTFFKPYVESSKTNPLNFYGITKLKGEKKILEYDLNKSIIIRTSWLYSSHENNFVSKIIHKLNKAQDISVTCNEIGSPTNALDLANNILYIIPKLKNKKTEIYHFCNTGYCSRYDFAVKINEMINTKSKIIPQKKSNDRLKRPKFSALNNSKIKSDFNIKINSWEESLERHLNLVKLSSLKYEF
tara:strand:- start:1024 stop:1908 length:885 start_codon:yes stop_codon:yes gene_type:complete